MVVRLGRGLLQLGDGHLGRREVGVAESEVDDVLAGAASSRVSSRMTAKTYGGSPSSRRNEVSCRGPACVEREAEVAEALDRERHRRAGRHVHRGRGARGAGRRRAAACSRRRSSWLPPSRLIDAHLERARTDPAVARGAAGASSVVVKNGPSTIPKSRSFGGASAVARNRATGDTATTASSPTSPAIDVGHDRGVGRRRHRGVGAGECRGVRELNRPVSSKTRTEAAREREQQYHLGERVARVLASRATAGEEVLERLGGECTTSSPVQPAHPATLHRRVGVVEHAEPHPAEPTAKRRDEWDSNRPLEPSLRVSSVTALLRSARRRSDRSGTPPGRVSPGALGPRAASACPAVTGACLSASWIALRSFTFARAVGRSIATRPPGEPLRDLALEHDLALGPASRCAGRPAPRPVRRSEASARLPHARRSTRRATT